MFNENNELCNFNLNMENKKAHDFPNVQNHRVVNCPKKQIKSTQMKTLMKES